MKYRKKPIEVDAMQIKDFYNLPHTMLPKWIADGYDQEILIPDKQTLLIETLEGRMKATLEDWLVQGVEGEYWFVKKSIFEKTYEIVS